MNHPQAPSNPSLRLVDVSAAVAAARSLRSRHPHEVVVLMDATWLSPVLCRPLSLGVDLVLHSLTKYIAGHTDVLAGAVIAAFDGPPEGESGAGTTTSDTPVSSTSALLALRDGDARSVPVMRRVRKVQAFAGGVASPFECFLAMRGMRTLPLRVRRQATTAGKIAAALEGHPAVLAVHYPGLRSHPQHELALRLFDADARSEDGKERVFGGMLSIRVKGGRDAAIAVAAAVRVFRRATSLGGTESLIEHRASVEPPDTPTPPDLLRLSIGLEDADELIADLCRALGT